MEDTISVRRDRRDKTMVAVEPSPHSPNLDADQLSWKVHSF
jgi:hypothetical protein